MLGVAEAVTARFVKDDTYSPIEFKRSDYPNYVGVTTAIGNDPEKIEALNKWRKRVGVLEAEKISRQSIIIGDYVHGRMEALLEGSEIEQRDRRYLLNESVIFDHENEFFTKHEIESDEVLRQAEVVARRLENFLNKHVTKVYMTEFSLVSHRYKLVGMADALVEIDGQLTMLDFKNSKRLKKKDWISDYLLQVSAYSFMFEEVYGKLPDRALVAIGLRENVKKPLWQAFMIDPRDWSEHTFFHGRSEGLF